MKVNMHGCILAEIKNVNNYVWRFDICYRLISLRKLLGDLDLHLFQIWIIRLFSYVAGELKLWKIHEWMNFIIYIPPVKPEGQAQGCILQRQWQSGKDVGNYSTSRGVRTWRILDQVIIYDFCCFLQHALHGVHSPCNHRSVVRWCGQMRFPYVCSVCV